MYIYANVGKLEVDLDPVFCYNAQHNVINVIDSSEVHMKTMLNKLLAQMGVGAEVTEHFDDGVVLFTLPLGRIAGGIYENELWGDALIEDTDAALTFTFGDVYGDGEINFGEGTVNLNYLPESGLAYGGDLEQLVCDRIRDLYNIATFGSEQGMQGDDYLSLDIDEVL